MRGATATAPPAAAAPVLRRPGEAESVPPTGSRPGPPTAVATVRSRGPRAMIGIGIILVLITIAGAALAAIGTSRRSADLDQMLARTEPLANAAENLYAALSQADAAAASAFLSGGAESADDRQRYDTAIATAATSLATAASGVGSNPADATAVGTLATQLPIYTGLVDTARANNRQGYPVGAAYLREASALMRNTMLPAAATLYANQSGAVRDTQNSVAATPWWSLIAGIVVLAALLIGQQLLANRTRRRLNLGLLIAALVTLGWIAWLAIASISVSNDLADSRTSGSVPLENLVQARIFAQQARADETLFLIARGSGADNEKNFGVSSGEVQRRLAEVARSGRVGPAADAVTQLEKWLATHQQLISAANGGDYPGAVEIGTGQSATDFQALDGSIQQGIDEVRAVLRSGAEEAHSALNGLAIGITVLSLVAVGSIVFGLRPRVREYQ